MCLGCAEECLEGHTCETPEGQAIDYYNLVNDALQCVAQNPCADQPTFTDPTVADAPEFTDCLKYCYDDSECDTGEACANGACSCADECAPGDTGCSADGAQAWTCDEAGDGDDCLERVPHSCGTGKANLCAETKLFGIALPGGLAEYVCVPETLVHTLPENLDRSAAGLSEPMAVCVRGARIGDIGIGDRVAIIGAGTIGLLSIITAREAGAAEILITARHPHQQELARALGADRVYPSSKELLDDVGDQFIDVVVETVGGETETLTESVQVARTGGRISLLGVFTGNPKLPGMPFFSKELTLAASNCYSRENDQGDFAIGAELTAKHAGLIEPVVTHTFSLDEVDKAFAAADDKSQRTIKVQIRPGA